MSKKRERLTVKPRFVYKGHGVGLSLTPHNGTNEVHGAYYVLAAGSHLTSPNGVQPPAAPISLQVNGKAFEISFTATRGNVAPVTDVEVKGDDRLFLSTASLEGLKIFDAADRSQPRLQADLVSAGVLSRYLPSTPQVGSQAKPGRDGKTDTHNLIQGLQLDGKPVALDVDRTPLSLFPTFKGLREGFKKDSLKLREKYGHRFLRNGDSLPRDKIFATLVDLKDRDHFRQSCGNPRAAGSNNVIYLDGLGIVELGLGWRSIHALRIQMLRIVLDPTLRVEGHAVLNEGSLTRARQAVAGFEDEAGPELPQAELYCADVKSCGEDYPPTRGRR